MEAGSPAARPCKQILGEGRGDADVSRKSGVVFKLGNGGKLGSLFYPKKAWLSAYDVRGSALRSEGMTLCVNC